MGIPQTLHEYTIKINKKTGRLMDILVEEFNKETMDDEVADSFFPALEERDVESLGGRFRRFVGSIISTKWNGTKFNIPRSSVELNDKALEIYEDLNKKLNTLYCRHGHLKDLTPGATITNVHDASYFIILRFVAYALSENAKNIGEKVLRVLNAFFDRCCQEELFYEKTSLFGGIGLSFLDEFINQELPRTFRVLESNVHSVQAIRMNTNAISAAQKHLKNLQKLIKCRFIAIFGRELGAQAFAPNQYLTYFDDAMEPIIRDVYDALPAGASTEREIYEGWLVEYKTSGISTNSSSTALTPFRNVHAQALVRVSQQKVNQLTQQIMAAEQFKDAMIARYTSIARKNKGDCTDIADLLRAYQNTTMLYELFSHLAMLNTGTGWMWLLFKLVDIPAIIGMLDENFKMVEDALHRVSVQHLGNDSAAMKGLNANRLLNTTKASAELSSVQQYLNTMISDEVLSAVSGNLLGHMSGLVELGGKFNRQIIDVNKLGRIDMGGGSGQRALIEYRDRFSNQSQIEVVELPSLTRQEIEFFEPIIGDVNRYLFGKRVLAANNTSVEHVTYELNLFLRNNVINLLFQCAQQAKSPAEQNIYLPILESAHGQIIHTGPSHAVALKEGLPTSFEDLLNNIVNAIYNKAVTSSLDKEFVRKISAFGFVVQYSAVTKSYYLDFDLRKMLYYLQSMPCEVLQTSFHPPHVVIPDEYKEEELEVPREPDVGIANSLTQHIQNYITGIVAPETMVNLAIFNNLAKVYLRKKIELLVKDLQRIMLSILETNENDAELRQFCLLPGDQNPDGDDFQDNGVFSLGKYLNYFVSNILLHKGKHTSSILVILQQFYKKANPEQQRIFSKLFREKLFVTKLDVDEFTDLNPAKELAEQLYIDFEKTIPGHMEYFWTYVQGQSLVNSSLLAMRTVPEIIVDTGDNVEKRHVSISPPRRSFTAELPSLLTACRGTYKRQYELHDEQRKSDQSIAGIMGSSQTLGRLVAYVTMGKGAMRHKEGDKSLKIEVINRVCAAAQCGTSIKPGNELNNFKLAILQMMRSDLGITTDNYRDYTRLRTYLEKIIDKAFHIGRKSGGSFMTSHKNKHITKVVSLVDGIGQVKLPIVGDDDRLSESMTIAEAIENEKTDEQIMNALALAYSQAEQKYVHGKEKPGTDFFSQVFTHRDKIHCGVPDSAKKLRISV